MDDEFDTGLDENRPAPNPSSKKFKSKTKREDPLQFHAKPRELDAALSAKEMPIGRTDATSDRIFSSVTFSSLPLDRKLSSIIEKPESAGGLGLTTCTNVQSSLYPILLEKRQNVLIKSQTGSGKTLSYLVPVINDLMTLNPKVDRSEGCRALIMAPTRELCTQIAEVLDKLTKCCVWIVGGCITGGERRKSEKGRLRKGIVVLVGTPGRLLDHMSSTESFLLTKLRWVVLDEVDRLLDMGFEQTVLQIMSIVRGEKIAGLKEKTDKASTKDSKGRALNLQQKWEQQLQQQSKRCAVSQDLVLLMCSATLSRAVKALALPLLGSKRGGEGFLVVDADGGTVDTIRREADIEQLGADAGKLDGSSATATALPTAAATKASGTLLDKGAIVEAPAQLAQYFMMVTCKWRLAALMSFLRTHADQKVVVFLSTSDAVDYLSLLLREMDWPTELDSGGEYRGSKGEGLGEGGGGAGRSIEEEAEAAAALSALSANASQTLEPLECTFTGVLGPQHKMYRLHGNVPQAVRKAVYAQFCDAERGILLCTDVAARGLDLPNVDWILQYDPPCETADYVHRIGRTARKGRSGSALLFLLPSEAAYIPLLASHGLRPEALSLQSLFLEAAKFIPGAAKFKNVDEMSAVILQRRVERVVHDNKWLLFAGRQAFRSFVRAYATHSQDTKGIFAVQQLHLGHVAKSFGLRESPKALRSSEDVIGRIFNGAYSALNSSSARREERYGHGGAGKGGGGDPKKRKRSEDPAGSSGKRSKREKGASTSTSTQNPGVAVKSGKDRQKLKKMGKSAEGAAGAGKRGSSGGRSKGDKLTASGVFRKTTGYFKKKLRSQMTSEFSST